MSEAARVRTVRWGLIAAFLVALEVVPRLGLVNPIALVPLSEMVWQLWLLISDGILGEHIVRTLVSIVVAGAAAVVTGLPLGVLLWRLQRTRKVLQPYLTTYYAIPIFAFYPLFIAIFGLGAWPVIIIAWAWSVVAIVLNTVIGLAEVTAGAGQGRVAACGCRRGGCSRASTSRPPRRTCSPASSSPPATR